MLQAVPFEALFAPWLTPAAASPAWVLGNVLRWLLAMRPLYRKDIHIPA